MFTIQFGHDEYDTRDTLAAALILALHSFGSRVVFRGRIVFANV